MPPVHLGSPWIDCVCDVVEAFDPKSVFWTAATVHRNIQISTTFCIVKVNLWRAKLRLSVCVGCLRGVCPSVSVFVLHDPVLYVCWQNCFDMLRNVTVSAPPVHERRCTRIQGNKFRRMFGCFNCESQAKLHIVSQSAYDYVDNRGKWSYCICSAWFSFKKHKRVFMQRSSIRVMSIKNSPSNILPSNWQWAPLWIMVL